MTTDIVPFDPFRSKLQAATQIMNPTGAVTLPQSISEYGINVTYFLVHRDGIGASTVALMLEPFLPVEPLIMEVGTNVSRALKYVPRQDRHFHVQEADERSIPKALDWRLERPGTPAIIEVGRTLYKEAIRTAIALTSIDPEAQVIFMFIANEYDEKLIIPKAAREEGLKDVIVLGEYKGNWSKRSGVIPIPRLSNEVEMLVTQEGKSMREAFLLSQRAFSRVQFAHVYRSFGKSILEGIKP